MSSWRPPLGEGLGAFLRLAVEGYERGDVGGWGADANYVPEHARAELGYVLSREHRGQGLMPKAVRSNTR